MCVLTTLVDWIVTIVLFQSNLKCIAFISNGFVVVQFELINSTHSNFVGAIRLSTFFALQKQENNNNEKERLNGSGINNKIGAIFGACVYVQFLLIF